MKIEQLEYLVHLAETGSFTKTAKYFYTSQQGISYAIQQLEKELDIKLIERHHNKIVFTKAGNLLLEKAKDFVEKYKELHEYLHPLRKDDFSSSNCDLLKTKLLLYVNPQIVNTLLPQIIKQIDKNHKNIQLIAKEENRSDLLIKLLEPSKNDEIGLVGIPEAYFTEQFKQTYNFQSVYTENILILMSVQSPLSELQMLTINEISQYPVVLSNDDPKNNRAFKGFFNGEDPNIILQTSDRQLMRLMIKKNMAVGFTTNFIESFFNNSGLTTVPIQPPRKFHIGFISKKHQPLSPVMEEFISIVKRVFYKHLQNNLIG